MIEQTALSDAHELLWFAEQLRPGTVLHPTCEVHRTFSFRRRPDLRLLERVLDQVVARHDALRTVPVVDGGELRVRAQPGNGIALEEHRLPPAAGPADVRRAVQTVATAPYDLRTGPLLRGAWLEAAGEGGFLVLGMHHWAGDDGALDALQADVSSLYASFVDGEAAPPPPRPYREVAHRGALDADAVAWWSARLAGARRGSLPVADGRSGTGSTSLVSRRLAGAADAALHRLAAGNRASPFMVLLAALSLLLEDGSPAHDATVFTVDGGRTGDARAVVGFLAEPLPLRLRVDLQRPFTAAIDEARSVVVGALKHRGVPFVRLLAAAPHLASLLATGPPTTVVQYFSLRPLVLGELTGDPVPTFESATDGEHFSSVVPLDLAINFERVHDHHTVGVVYDDGLWTTDEIHDALDALESVLQRADRDPNRPALELLERA